jgi:anaerobic selenocysteine-containing dehydrogenase
MENIVTIDSVCAYCGVGCDIAAHVDTKRIKSKRFLHILMVLFLKENSVLKGSMVLILWMHKIDSAYLVYVKAF